MSARFISHQYVPSGFEILIDIPELEMGKIWNLWWNVTLSDDPETWDSEVILINKMQDRLSALSEDQRLIRAQMAEFCRYHPLFPQSIDILCEEIGTGRFSQPAKMGCEGRGLLDSLGYHDPRSLNNQLQEIIKDYSLTLQKWLAKAHPENPIDSRLFGFLGQQTDGKVAFIKKLVSALNSRKPLLPVIRQLCAEECRNTHGDSIFDVTARPFNCFNCDESAVETPRCQCSYTMLLNAALICSRIPADESSIYELHIFVWENTLVYATAINAWLKDSLALDFAWPETNRYVTGDNFLDITQRINSALGKKDETKEWLAACLLKTVKSNQRWHKRTELIDNYPQATSWLGEISTTS
jgi:hypothetical protein